MNLRRVFGQLPRRGFLNQFVTLLAICSPLAENFIAILTSLRRD